MAMARSYKRDPVGIQTQDLQNRNLTLYSAKLRDQMARVARVMLLWQRLMPCGLFNALCAVQVHLKGLLRCKGSKKTMKKAKSRKNFFVFGCYLLPLQQTFRDATCRELSMTNRSKHYSGFKNGRSSNEVIW